MSAIERKRGDTWADEFIIKNKRTKAPINITGYSFVLVVDPNKAPPDDTTNLYSVTGAILDAAAGRVEFPPEPDDVDRVGNFYYEVQMTDGAGRKRTIVADKYVFKQDIAKA